MEGTMDENGLGLCMFWDPVNTFTALGIKPPEDDSETKEVSQHLWNQPVALAPGPANPPRTPSGEPSSDSSRRTLPGLLKENPPQTLAGEPSRTPPGVWAPRSCQCARNAGTRRLRPRCAVRMVTTAHQLNLPGGLERREPSRT